jgi:glycosyltransferase involved in cell wall biosynthesis
MRILIYDSFNSTHLYDYCEYILEYLSNLTNTNDVYYILVNKNVYDYVTKNIDIKLIDNEKSNINFNFIPSKIYDKFNKNNNILFRTFYENNYIDTFCHSNSIDYLILLQIDAFQIAIASRFIFKRKHINVSGILMTPFVQEPNTLLKKIRKFIQIKLLLFNAEVKKIFIFNDQFSVDKLNNITNTKKFIYLPDPIKIRNFIEIDFKNKFQLVNGRIIITVIGGISERKNIHRIIEALKYMPEKYINKYYLLICGKFSSEKYKSLITEIITQEIKENIIIYDSFLSTNEYESLTKISNCILVLYSNFYSSSGIIGLAAKHNKTIIASNVGIVGRIVEQYGLGMTVNPNSYPDILNAILRLFENNYDYSKSNNRNEFVNKSSYLLFAQQLLKT